MSNISEVAICNIALNWLGERPLTSLDDPGVPATSCRINYAQARDAVLEEAEWGFARGFYALPELMNPEPDPRPPLRGKLYLKPPEALAVRRADDGNDDWSTHYQIIGTYIHSSDGPEPLYIEATKLVTDPSRFAATFVQALAARIAASIAGTITERSSVQTRMWELYNTMMTLAEASEGKQGTSPKTRSRRLRVVRR